MEIAFGIMGALALVVLGIGIGAFGVFLYMLVNR